MARFIAVFIGLFLIGAVPLAGLADGKSRREEEMAQVMRAIMAETRDPAEVSERLGRHGARFVGLQISNVSFVHTDGVVTPTGSTNTVVGPGLRPSVSSQSFGSQVRPMAGDKTDFTLSLWAYEWRNLDGTYTEQSMISGYWTDTEYSWLDEPLDVIDVRWTVGDLVYLSSAPYDGVRRDQHTNGIASFTVPDQVGYWDLFVNFKPVSSAVHGKWTNIFANYTHTWFGVKLSITLGSAQHGATGSITISTDGKTWTEGTGLALQIGSQGTSGPASTGLFRRLLQR